MSALLQIVHNHVDEGALTWKLVEGMYIGLDSKLLPTLQTY